MRVNPPCTASEWDEHFSNQLNVNKKGGAENIQHVHQTRRLVAQTALFY